MATEAWTNVPHQPSDRIIVQLLNGCDVSDSEVVDAVSRSFNVDAVRALFATGLSVEEVAKVLGLSDRTLRRYLKNGNAPLSLVESDRLVRIARILGFAFAAFGDHVKALGWLRTPVWAVGNRVPLDLIAIESGVQMVRQSLSAIAYGGVA